MEVGYFSAAENGNVISFHESKNLSEDGSPKSEVCFSIVLISMVHGKPAFQIMAVDALCIILYSLSSGKFWALKIKIQRTYLIRCILWN